MEFHESGLLRFKQKADMGTVFPLHKSTVGGRKDQDLVLTGNNNPVGRDRILSLICHFN
jgi:beta-sarcoglycan